MPALQALHTLSPDYTLGVFGILALLWAPILPRARAREALGSGWLWHAGAATGVGVRFWRNAEKHACPWVDLGTAALDLEVLAESFCDVVVDVLQKRHGTQGSWHEGSSLGPFG